MDRRYSDNYTEIYSKHWWWRAREEAVVETLRRHCPRKGQGQVIDIGCGDGLLFDRLAEFGHVEGVEPDRTLISNRYRSRIYPVPFDEQFQPGKEYSLVLMLDVLEHLPNAPAAFCHALNLLVPGGVLLITVPAFQALWTSHDELNHHVRRYTKSTFRAMANGAPLEILEERYLFQSLFPAKLAVRAVERVCRLAPHVPSVPPSWANHLLRRYFRMEEELFRKVPVPLGSSLLVVARKLP